MVVMIVVVIKVKVIVVVMMKVVLVEFAQGVSRWWCKKRRH